MPDDLEETRKEFRNLLAEHKRRLWTELREEIFSRNADQISSQYDIPQDLGEKSILDELSDAGLAVADIRREQLTQLDEAQKRVEMGTYGICEGCGERIGIERLRVVPFSPYCVNCQKGKEGPSKPPGVTL
ncbi:MAG TPA: molecular chaperone DnaK [Geobacter sp.]|nr:molecular chaperone DnaK [Geobacter sp.]